MIKRFLFILIGFTIPISLFGQVIDGFPTDEKGKINFNNIVKVDSVNKKVLYSKAKQFFANTFKSANNVIQMDDIENAILIGKGYSDIVIETRLKKKVYPVAVQLWYSLKIQCKDSRYKYEVYDLYFKTASYDMTSPAEETFAIDYFDKAQRINNNKLTDEQITMMKELMEQYKTKTLMTINSLINSLNIAMAKKGNEEW